MFKVFFGTLGVRLVWSAL